MSFEKMTLNQRIQAVNIDCMRNKDFALLTGVICMGKSEVVDKKGLTAYTNGKDKRYGAQFIAGLNRKQLRYLVLHENFHVALKHCTLYKAVSKQKPRLVNMAMDYVVNGIIEEMDNSRFVERPTESLLYDKKYVGWSFPQVLRDLVENGQDGKGGESGEGEGEPLDEHEMGDFDGESAQELEKEVDAANQEGDKLARKLRGTGKGGRDILGVAKARDTDWVTQLREFISSMCAGDDCSRFCPPNKRLLPLGFVMPSHFSETIGEIIIACDTSGSMHGYYGTVFGEIARICESVKPEKVRVMWWDTRVCAEQEFTEKDYGAIANILKPKGGGGTVVSCVAQRITEQQYKPKAVIYLTDGYIESSYEVAPFPALWGVVNNEDFRPLAGKVLHIKAD